MTRNIRLLYLHNFLIDFRFQAAFLPIYFAQITGSYAVGMAVFSVATIFSAVMDIPTGILSDKIGRKFTLVLASVCTTAGTALYAFATGSAGLFVAGMFSGLGKCLFNGNNNALLYESLKTTGQQNEFPHYQGRAGSMSQIALGLSAFCASFLTGHGLRFILMLGIIPHALSVITGLFFAEPGVHMSEPQKNLTHLKAACVKICRNPHLLLLIIAQALSSGAGEAKFVFQTAYINMLWPTWAVAIFRALNHTLGFLGFWFAGRIVKRFREKAVLTVQQAYWLVSQIIALALSNVVTPVIFLSAGIFYGPGIVARDHLLQKEFTDEQRATMGSVASFTGSFVFAGVSFGIGAIADRFGLAAGVGFGVFVGALSCPVYLLLFRKGS